MKKKNTQANDKQENTKLRNLKGWKNNETC